MAEPNRAGCRIYLYPQESGENLYLSMCKKAWQTLGYQVNVMPTSPWNFLNSLRKDVAVLNWFEDRLGHADNQTIAFIKACVLVALIRLRFRRVVWVRHNLKPHNEHSVRFYNLLKRVLDRISDRVVTHRRVNGIDSLAMPHPLYPFDPDWIMSEQNRDIEYLYFGAVKRYKGLASLLQEWPVDKPLYMAGRCDDQQLRDELNGIIEERQLKVLWENKFLEYEELCRLIGRSQYVLIPHVDESMIVSGAFYHAVSGGANVLVADNDFYHEYLAPLPYVNSIGSTMDGAEMPVYVNPEVIREDAAKKWGIEAVAEAWRHVLNDH